MSIERRSVCTVCSNKDGKTALLVCITKAGTRRKWVCYPNCSTNAKTDCRKARDMISADLHLKHCPTKVIQGR